MSKRMAKAKRGDASDGAAPAMSLGARVTRLDGPAKIRGAAVYGLEHRPERLVLCRHRAKHDRRGPRARDRHGGGRGLARRAPGADPRQRLAACARRRTGPARRRPMSPICPLARDITFNGQHVAAVVAETFEQATAAAALVKVAYEETPAIAGLDDPKAGDGMPMDPMTKEWGDAAAAFAERARPHRARVQDAARIPCADRAPWADRPMGGRFAHRLGAEPMDRRHGAQLCRMVRPPLRQGAADLALYRRRLRVEGASPMPTARWRPWRPRCSTGPSSSRSPGPRPSPPSAAAPATRQTIALGATREGKLLSIVHRGANETSIDGICGRALGLGHLDHVRDARISARARTSCR